MKSEEQGLDEISKQEKAEVDLNILLGEFREAQNDWADLFRKMEEECGLSRDAAVTMKVYPKYHTQILELRRIEDEKFALFLEKYKELNKK